MTEQNTAVANTAENKPLSPEDQAIMDELRRGSGELEQGGNYSNIPYITINNKMVLEKTANGREVKARCEPEFVLNTQEDGEYKEEIFANEFHAVILAVRHRTQRKFITDQNKKCINELPYYRSLEFKSFSSPVHVKQNKEFFPPMTYQQAKNMSPEGKENELWGIAYVLIAGEDTVRKVEVKGASRGILFDYVTEKKPTSISGTVTKFSLEIDNENATPYNKLVITNENKVPSDLKKVLDRQRELLAILDAQETPNFPAESGQVVGGVDMTNVNTMEQLQEVAEEKGAEEETKPADSAEQEAKQTPIEDLF